MYLKSLTLQGFKTFANKTEIQLGPGITAIVGPNGSGKSNIADAIRWVLGEQSARQLRSGRMEDVIFGGSSKARPLGFADVTAVLDNEDRHFPVDFSDVAIKRRYHRSGESEFAVNKNSCRLTDVQNMLMDTGLGKGTYSIIGQGQVSSVLSSKPEERRAIFEEAAGINRFKHQKRKAENRLDATQVNLMRLGDIIHELEARLPSLAEEAEKAEKAQGLMSRLKELEKLVFLKDFEKLRGELAQISAVVKELEENTAAAEAGHQTVELDLEQKQLAFSEAEKALHQLAQEKTRVEAGRTDWMNRLKHHGELTRTLAKEEERAAQSQAQFTQRLDAIVRELAVLQEKADLLAERQASTRAATAVAEDAARDSQQRYAVMAQESSSRQRELLSCLDEGAKLKEGLATLQENVRWRENSQVKLVEEVTRLSEERDGTAAAQTQAKAELENQEKERATAQTAFEVEKKALEDCQASLDRLQKEREDLVKSLSKTRAELDLLKKLQEQGEGLEEGVRFLQRAGREGRLNGFVGLLGELIQAPAELLDAVESALGQDAQLVVFEDGQSAQDALDSLVKEGKGRAAVWGCPAGEAAAAPAGSLAAQLTVSGPALGLVNRLLGRVKLVEDFSQAGLEEMAVLASGRLRTLDGVLLDGKPKGAAQSPLRRQDQLTRLSVALTELEGRLKAIEEEAGVAKDGLAQARLKRDELRLELEKLGRTVAVAREQQTQLERQLTRISKDLESREHDLVNSRRKAEEEAQELNRLKEKFTLQQETQARLEQERQSLADNQQALLAEKEEKDQALATARLMQSEVEGGLREVNSLAGNLQAEQNRLQENLDQVERTLKSTREELLSLEGFDEEYQVAITSLAKQHEDLAQKLETATKHEVAVNEALADLQTKRRRLAEEARTFRERLEGEKLRQARLEARSEEFAALAAAQFSLDAAALEEALVEEVDLPHGARAETRRLREDLETLGFVNYGAIKEKDSVQNRLEFLKMHYEDLFQARQKLFDLIKDIEEQTKEAFLGTFEAIKTAFHDLFGGMVPGGRGELSLTDPENPLESGIDILVMMPGKAKGPLTRLSGGEQTLTAITLLFSILRVKPSPFCLLDEIEAALDEPNTVRFTRFLKDFSGGVQFLVITHNKRTMEAADTLVGITMQEDGISKVVSVKLSEVQGDGGIKTA